MALAVVALAAPVLGARVFVAAGALAFRESNQRFSFSHYQGPLGRCRHELHPYLGESLEVLEGHEFEGGEFFRLGADKGKPVLEVAVSALYSAGEERRCRFLMLCCALGLQVRGEDRGGIR